MPAFCCCYSTAALLPPRRRHHHQHPQLRIARSVTDSRPRTQFQGLARSQRTYRGRHAAMIMMRVLRRQRQSVHRGSGRCRACTWACCSGQGSCAIRTSRRSLPEWRRHSHTRCYSSPCWARSASVRTAACVKCLRTFCSDIRCSPAKPLLQHTRRHKAAALSVRHHWIHGWLWTQGDHVR